MFGVRCHGCRPGVGTIVVFAAEPLSQPLHNSKPPRPRSAARPSIRSFAIEFDDAAQLLPAIAGAKSVDAQDPRLPPRRKASPVQFGQRLLVARLRLLYECPRLAVGWQPGKPAVVSVSAARRQRRRAVRRQKRYASGDDARGHPSRLSTIRSAGSEGEGPARRVDGDRISHEYVHQRAHNDYRLDDSRLSGAGPGQAGVVQLGFRRRPLDDDHEHGSEDRAGRYADDFARICAVGTCRSRFDDALQGAIFGSGRRLVADQRASRRHRHGHASRRLPISPVPSGTHVPGRPGRAGLHTLTGTTPADRHTAGRLET